MNKTKPLEITCPHCQTAVPLTSEFCPACGQRLPSIAVNRSRYGHHLPESTVNAFKPASLSDKIKAATAVALGQRRLVTVVVLLWHYQQEVVLPSDEEAKFLLERDLTQLTTEVIRALEGHVDRSNNQRIVAIFGAPLMHENHAERAIRAAFILRERLLALQPDALEKYGAFPAIHIGINSGTVILGKLGTAGQMEYTVVGNTVKIASALAGLATQGMIRVSQTTHQLTSPLFEFCALPPAALPGSKEKAAAYEPVKIHRKSEQIRHLAGKQLPLIGRQQDLDRLEDAWQKVNDEGGLHVVLVTGEAGVGKSRLTLEFVGALSRRDTAVFRARCQEHLQAHPYWVLAELVRQIIDIPDYEPPGVQREILDTFLSVHGLSKKEIRPFLVNLLGIGTDELETEQILQRYDADMLQNLLQNAVRQLIRSIAHDSPTILVVENLQWGDAASWDFLTYLIHSSQQLPLLLILSAREFEPQQWVNLAPQQTRLHLDSLSPSDSYQLIQQLIVQSEPDAEMLTAQIARRAAGNPFYIEELIRMLIDQGGIVQNGNQWHFTSQAASLVEQVPGTLQALILSRFDRLPDDIQKTLQKTAVLGLSFPLHLLAQLDETPLSDISDHLHYLVMRRFLIEDTVKGEGFYTFKHALVQEAIYTTMLKRQRQTLHGLAATAVENSQFWLAEDQAQLLAYHYSRSRHPLKAVPSLLKMADEAAQRFANETAVQNYRQVLVLLEHQPADENKEPLLKAKIGLGKTLKFLGQYNQAQEILDEALQTVLSWSLSAAPDVLITMMVNGLQEMADIQARQANYDQAIEYLEAGLEALGEKGYERHPRLYRAISERIVFVLFRQGQLTEAFDLAQVTVADMLADPDPDLVILANLYNTMGGISWQQGKFDAAVQFVKESLQRYELLNYVWGKAHVFNNLGILKGQQGDWPQTERYWEQALSLRQEIGDVQNEAMTLLNLSQLRLSMGDFEKATSDLDDALEILHRLNDLFGIARAYTLQAQAALHRGEIAQAVEQIQKALELADQVGGQEICIEARWVQALVLAEQDQLMSGQEAATRALRMAREAGLRPLEVDCLRVVGALLARGGNYLESEEHLRQSWEISRQLNDPYKQGLALLEMGLIYQTLWGVGQELPAAWHGRCQTALEGAAEILGPLGAKFHQERVETALQFLAENQPAEEQQGSPLDGPEANQPSGERYTAVILWLNLGFPSQTDEEIIFEIMSSVLPACTAIAEEHGGSVRQRPDGLIITFGIPQAYEGDAEQAVQTAYHIGQYVAQHELQAEIDLTVQMAINQGVVLAAALHPELPTDYMLQGEPIEVARLAATAVTPNQIWVTEAVQLATKRLFTYQPLPPLKEVSSPLWRLVGLQEAPAPARGVPGIQTRFVGRNASLEAMVSLAQNLEDQIGGIIWIEGEAGIGKSRLMREFKTAVHTPHSMVMTAGCTPQRSDHAFSLFTDLLIPVFDLEPSDDNNQIRQKIKQVISHWPPDAQATRPYLEMLAGIQPEGFAGDRLHRLEPEQLRQQIFVAMRRLLISLAARQPLIIFLDDLHWIDPISAELLIFIITSVTSEPILFVCAQRREGSDSPNDRLVRMQSLLPGQTVRLLLDRLSPELSRQLLDDLLPGADLPEKLLNLVVERSEGNPYFIEEFVRMFMEQGYMEQREEGWQIASRNQLDTAVIPSSLETLIRSRIDALPDNLKRTLQYAAVIGHEFDLEILTAVMQQPNVGLWVQSLASRLMLQPIPESNRWKFSHTLYETVVYNSLLKTDRQALHRQVAQILAGRWAQTKTEHAKELAFHYLQADEQTDALPYLIQAGEQAAGQHATEEALAHFQKAADILQRQKIRHKKWEWQIAVCLGDVYSFVGQFDAALTALKSALPLAQTNQLHPAEKAGLYRRMGETARKQGDFETARAYFLTAQKILAEPDDLQLQLEMARTLLGFAWIYFAQGQLQETREACEQSLTYAQKADSLNELATAHNLLGGVYYHQSEWREAFHHTTKAMVLREQMGYSWGVAATLSNLGILAFVAGHWAKAISFFERSLALRQEMGDVEGIVITQNNLGNAYRGHGKFSEAEHFYREGIKTAKLFAIVYHEANSSVGLAHVVLSQGRISEAETILTGAIEQAETIGAQEILAEAYRVQAELLLAKQEFQQVFAAANQAVSLAVSTGNRSYEAAAWRVAAQAALAQNDLASAEEFIGQAEKSLSGTMDDLEAGHVAALACRLYSRAEKFDAAEEKRRTAREIYQRQEADYFLNLLEAEISL